MSVETLTAKILSRIPKIGKCQQKFLTHFFTLMIAFRGRSNFENLARQGQYNESTYRNNYDKDFDFFEFNKQLIESVCDKERAIVFDPSFISKSGKLTPGLGYFWSGVAGRAKIGLEIGGFGVVDIENNTCMHLTAVQTLNHKKCDSVLKYYAETVCGYAVRLQSISKRLLVDAYFSKYNFVQQVCEAGLDVISRLRDDSVLSYRYLGPKRSGRGRPKKFQGKVDVKQPDENHFELVLEATDTNVYEGEVYSKPLKRWIKVALVHHLKPNGALKKVKIYFSTDSTISATELLIYYSSRFQIEFLYRDAKQFTGLEHCQSRKEKRLDFHFNASLTAVSLAKAAHYLNVPKEERKAFSMFSVKAQYFNELLLNRFFSAFGIDPNSKKNNLKYLSLRKFGKIAA